MSDSYVNSFRLIPIIDVTDNVSYYVLKVPSIRHLSNIQNRGICGISHYLEMELNSSFAKSSFVVLIFSVIGTHTFDGYAIMSAPIGDVPGKQFNPSDYASNINVRPVKVHFIRRSIIPFQQVSHIRDDKGLQGRPVSSAKDGMKLGAPAGRTLCRAIDKRAYKDDPIHYHDVRYDPRVLPDSTGISTMNVSKDLRSFSTMTYQEYVEWYNSKRQSTDYVPTLANIR